MERIIEVNHLSKFYGNVQAVNDLSFYVDKGSLFAFLGPNGAGKSTTIDIITTILSPDSGEVVIDGHRLGVDDAKIRDTIGVVFQDSLLDGLLTVEENLKTRGMFYHYSKRELAASIAESVAATDVESFLKRRYNKLSGGQRRRADIARALVNRPKILFLDEPTTGLDPQTRKKVWEMIRILQHKNKMTIFLTTHYMEEADGADYVVVIDEGKIAAKGTPSELKNVYASDKLILHFSDQQRGEALLAANQIPFQRIADQYLVKVNGTLDSLPIVDLCKPFLKGFEVFNGSMDDAFIGITGKEIRND